jgi:thioredoxin 2
VLRTCPSCGARNRVPAERLADIGRCGRCKGPLANDAPIEVPDAATFDPIIGGARVPVMVDFWAPWCGPCRMVAPEVAKAARQVAGRAVVLKVNTEQLPALASRYRVSGIPDFAVFDAGALVDRRAGAMPAVELVKLVDRACSA